MGNREAVMKKEGMRTMESAGGTQWMNCQCTKTQTTRCKGQTLQPRQAEVGVLPGFKTGIAASEVTVANEPAVIGGFGSYSGRH